MKKYRPQAIEKKWQKEWERMDVAQASDASKKRKYYVLVEFPYPSGDGLHVGHARPYIALDIIARKRRMEGYNVLFPMGWDAFGLPTENYAIKTGIHPRAATQKNTAKFKLQQKRLGLSFDWTREINTTDPAYYKWTQWIFVQLFKKGLAYKTTIAVNWCPSCKIGLANEEVIDGSCERCSAKVIGKEKEQWMLKITKYAERLLEGLENVDYPERVKAQQREWIGKSEGVEIAFSIPRLSSSVSVFTTRIDTVFGATYLVVAPEHPIVEKLKLHVKNRNQLEAYIAKAKGKLDRERIAAAKEKTGVRLQGLVAKNPATEENIPIFVADYVLLSYGTGAIMGVPAHDRRDLDFANRYNLPVIEVIKSPEREKRLPRRTPLVVEGGKFQQAYEGEGILARSQKFDGMRSETARKRITEWLQKKGVAKEATHYKLKDWIFSRQRYWGEPIPMIRCELCGWMPVPEETLPVILPRIRRYKPTEKGESPLARAKSWVMVPCPKCKGSARRETDVMPNWAGSNWYYLRYCDPANDRELASKAKLNYWMPVDWYNGGMEHTTLHLLYSRFIYKFLWDIKAVPRSVGSEPYKKRTSHGIVLGEGSIKMSKSKGNVINPDTVIRQYGADTIRMYEMFMGPFEQMIPWDTKGAKGVRRFLEKVWKLAHSSLNPDKTNSSLQIKKFLHKTIKKVGEDIESLKFNTATSALMEFCNAWQESKEGIGRKDFQDFLKIFSVFAPHLAEELWQQGEFGGSVQTQTWPRYNPTLVREKMVTLVVQINGKVRDNIEAEAGITEAEAKKRALAREKIKKWLEKRRIKKTVFVPDKLINFVV